MDDKDLLAPFRFRLDPKSGTDDEPEEAVASGNAYATARGTRSPISLKFIRIGRPPLAVPYGFLPVVWWQSPELIMIEYPSLFTVSLAGLRLTTLGDRVADQRVTWIRECSDAEAVTMPLAVTRIRTLRTFPSHDIDEG